MSRIFPGIKPDTPAYTAFARHIATGSPAVPARYRNADLHEARMDRDNGHGLNAGIHYVKRTYSGRSAIDDSQFISWRPPRPGLGLILHGPQGVGKTHIAAAIANELYWRFTVANLKCIDHTVRSAVRPRPRPLDIRFYDWTTYLESTRPGGGNQGAKTPATECSLLILDDLGKENTTAYVHERLHTLLNTRYSTARPTIITTNLTPDEITGTDGDDDTPPMAPAYDAHIADRIREMCFQIILTGNSRRRAAAI